MKTLLTALVTVMFFAAAQPAHAILYFEPYVGYEQGNLKGDFSGTLPNPLVPGTTLPYKDTIAASLHGPVFGGKAGLSFLMVAFGVDASGGAMKSGSSSGTATDIGGFVSVSIPAVCKFSVTSFFSDTLKYSDSTSNTSIKFTGKSGFKAGVGFPLAPMVSLNLDYVSIKYDKTSSPGLEALGLTFDKTDLTRSGAFLSLSLPLSF